MSKGAKAVRLELGAGGDKREFWLQFDIDKVCQMEELLDLDVLQIEARLPRSGRLGFLRVVLWAGLQTHQPALSLREAGELLAAPGSEAIRPKIIEAYQKAFPLPEAAEGALDPQGTPEA
jgi:hypothetical protein